MRNRRSAALTESFIQVCWRLTVARRCSLSHRRDGRCRSGGECFVGCATVPAVRGWLAVRLSVGYWLGHQTTSDRAVRPVCPGVFAGSLPRRCPIIGSFPGKSPPADNLPTGGDFYGAGDRLITGIHTKSVIIFSRADFSWGRHFNVTPVEARDQVRPSCTRSAYWGPVDTPAAWLRIFRGTEFDESRPRPSVGGAWQRVGQSLLPDSTPRRPRCWCWCRQVPERLTRRPVESAA